MKPHIQIVEDEIAIQQMLIFNLSRAGYDIGVAGDTQEADLQISEKLPDLILLDWMLPQVSGIEYTRRLCRNELTQSVPIIMLTAHDSEDDRVLGLTSGIDDYVAKPFSIRELCARIDIQLQKATNAPDSRLVAGDFVIDYAAFRVTAGGMEIKLTPIDFCILRLLSQSPDRVFERHQILDRIWGMSSEVDDRTIDVHIRRLRKALQPSGYDHVIQTVRGAGYRFSYMPNRTSE